MEEQTLIKQCKARNHFAQRKLYEQYVSKIFLVVMRYVADAQTAEEITADCFIKCFEKMELFAYQGEGSLGAWLKKIAVNECLSYLRKRKIRFEAEEKIIDQLDYSTMNTAFSKMQHDEIVQTILQLPEGYRTVFNLFSIEGFTHAEIAQQLNISEETSRSQLYKARLALQKNIKR